MQTTVSYDSPIGRLVLVAEDGALVRIVLPPVDGVGDEPQPPAPATTGDPTLARASAALDAYFAGDLRAFDDLPLAPHGSDFDRRVWDALRAIPYGATVSYAELAASVGVPRAARAVGQANGRNPLPIVVPCHRVVASGGKLGGYAGGLDAKRTLLDLERR